MPVSLSLKTSIVSQDEINRTSTISVTVNVTYDSGSHNGYTDSVNGAILSISVGSYSDSFVQPFNAGASTSGTETLYSNTFMVSHGTASNAISVPVYVSYNTNTGSGTVTASDTITLPGITYSGGDSGDSSGDDSGDNGDSSGGSGSNNESNTDLLVHPDTNCTYLGTAGQGLSYGNLAAEGLDVSKSRFYIKFRTPSDLTESTSITVRLNNYGVYYGYDNYSLTFYLIDNSDGSHNGYNEVYMASADGLPDTLKKMYDSYDVIIPTTELKPDTEYIIRIKSANNNTMVYADAPIGIIINYVARGGVHIKTNGTVQKYYAYIKVSGNWDLYEPYIKNGSTWDVIGT